MEEFPVARAALAGGATHLGVATVDEGVALRMRASRHPNYRSRQPPHTAAETKWRTISRLLCSRAFVRALGEAALRRGRIAGYGLKVDTGMNRIGVRAEARHGSQHHAARVPLDGTFTWLQTADVETTGSVRQSTKLQHIWTMKTEGINSALVVGELTATFCENPLGTSST